MENYEQLVKGVEKEAVNILVEIEATHNPIKKRRLLKQYTKLIEFLALKPKTAFLCRCGKIECYTTPNGIEINQCENECLIIIA